LAGLIGGLEGGTTGNYFIIVVVVREKYADPKIRLQGVVLRTPNFGELPLHIVQGCNPTSPGMILVPYRIFPPSPETHHCGSAATPGTASKQVTVR